MISAQLYPSVKKIPIIKITFYNQDRYLGFTLDIDLFLNFHINSSTWHIHSISKIFFPIFFMV